MTTSDRRQRVAALGLAVLAGLAGALRSPDAASSAEASAPAGTEPAVVSATPFQLRNGFWINLHHALYEQSLPLNKSVDKSVDKSAEKGAASAADRMLPTLGPEERKAWSEALAYYRAEIGPHDVFERGMEHVDYTLADLADGASPSRAPLKPELAAALERAAPVYRAHGWPAQERANRFWIAVAAPMVRELGPEMMERLAAAYRVPWPGRPILVDVVSYANWAGGYTTLGDPMHTVITSVEPGYQGFAALEMLFHEASHTLLDGRNDPVTRAVEREARTQGRKAPGNLTHAIIFYTAGEVARRTLAEAGVKDYVPAADHGLWARAWPTLKEPLDRFWLPYLDGKLGFDPAIAGIVGALPAAPAAAPTPPAPKPAAPPHPAGG